MSESFDETVDRFSTGGTMADVAEGLAYHRELDRANRAIRDRDALIEFEDGSTGVVPGIMPEAFLEYYGRLVAAGYAKGYLK